MSVGVNGGVAAGEIVGVTLGVVFGVVLGVELGEGLEDVEGVEDNMEELDLVRVEDSSEGKAAGVSSVVRLYIGGTAGDMLVGGDKEVEVVVDDKVDEDGNEGELGVEGGEGGRKPEFSMDINRDHASRMLKRMVLWMRLTKT